MTLPEHVLFLRVCSTRREGIHITSSSSSTKESRSDRYAPIVGKAEYLAVTADILKSFPDFVYTREGPIAYADSPKLVSWVAVVKGTHSKRLQASVRASSTVC